MYPAIQRVKWIVDIGELGKIKSIRTEFCLPKGVILAGDIREHYALGGGATMDLGGASHLLDPFARNTILNMA